MTEAHDTVLHIVARASNTSRCVDIFHLRSRISANTNQSF